MSLAYIQGRGTGFPVGSLWRPCPWEGCVFPGGERALGEVPGNPKSYLPPRSTPSTPPPPASSDGLPHCRPLDPQSPPLSSPDQSPPLRTHWCWGTNFVFLKMEKYVLFFFSFRNSPGFIYNALPQGSGSLNAWRQGERVLLFTIDLFVPFEFYTVCILPTQKNTT